MTDETETTSEVARVLTEHFDPTGAERQDPYSQATYREAAQALAEAGLLREEPFSVEGMEIMSGWLVESAGEHTCGAGGSESGYAHEPGCGYVPVQRLDDLPGWPGAEIARLTDERDRLKRGGAELGRQIERYLTWVLDATGMHHLIDEDGDGDWGLVWERLAEMGQARKANETKGGPR